MRLEKSFRFDRYRVGVFVDVFNLFNGNKATGIQVISSSPAIRFGEMTSIEDPRIFRLGRSSSSEEKQPTRSPRGDA